MTINNAVLAMAGTMVLISALLTWLVSPFWMFLSVFVGLNLFQSAFSGFCPAAMVFRKLGLNPLALRNSISQSLTGATS